MKNIALEKHGPPSMKFILRILMAVLLTGLVKCTQNNADGFKELLLEEEIHEELNIAEPDYQHLVCICRDKGKIT